MSSHNQQNSKKSKEGVIVLGVTSEGRSGLSVLTCALWHSGEWRSLPAHSHHHWQKQLSHLLTYIPYLYYVHLKPIFIGIQGRLWLVMLVLSSPSSFHIYCVISFKTIARTKTFGKSPVMVAVAQHLPSRRTALCVLGVLLVFAREAYG